jgi:hypothetical protein
MKNAPLTNATSQPTSAVRPKNLAEAFELYFKGSKLPEGAKGGAKHIFFMGAMAHSLMTHTHSCAVYREIDSYVQKETAEPNPAPSDN